MKPMAMSAMRNESHAIHRVVRWTASGTLTDALPVAMEYCSLIIGQKTVGVIAQISTNATAPVMSQWRSGRGCRHPATRAPSIASAMTADKGWKNPPGVTGYFDP